MFLNALEIKNLAEFALGIKIDGNGLGVDDSDLKDFEFYIESNVDVAGDDGLVQNYRRVVHCDGCEANERVPISEETKRTELEPTEPLRMPWLDKLVADKKNELELKHGAIYKFELYGNEGTIDARCNINSQGDEVWFTDQNGDEVSGRASKLIRQSDLTFRHRDIK